MPGGFLGPETLAAIFDHSADGILFAIPGKQILAANPAACRLLACSEAELCAGRNLDVADRTDDRWSAVIEGTRRPGHSEAEVRMRRGDGGVFEAHLSSSTFTAPDGALRAVVIFRDISEQVATHERLARDAMLDELTGLHNRRGFLALAEHEVLAADRDEADLDLLYLDIDRFKEFNDVHGHDAGDDVLRIVARALGDCCRASDVMARWGGDEFLVLMRRATDQDGSGLDGRIQPCPAWCR